MITIFLKQIRYFFVILLTLGLVSACGPQEPQLKPWGSSLLSKIEFSFSDMDMDKGEIAGDLILDIPSDLKPANISNYVVYWSSTPSKSGIGTKLTEAPATYSGKILYKIPENTVQKGNYFLLYLKAAAGEVASGKSIKITDKFVAAVEEEKKPEAKTEAVEPETKEPVVTETVKAQPTETPKVAPILAPVVVKPEAPTPQETPVEKVVTEAPQQQVLETLPIILIKNVLFEFDKSYLQSEFKAQLREDFADAENKSEMKLIISGHADERGSNEYNLALGERRAYAVKRYLIRLGFSADNIRIISYGEEKPVDPSHNEAAWAKNRRSETVVND